MRGNFMTDRNGAKNPNYKDGRKGTRLYRIYVNIKTRCYNPNSPAFKYYGNRGITVCDEWKNDFKVFYDWAMSHGYEEHLTIDRIEFDGNYSPENCRWVTIKEQSNNKRQNVIVTINNETHTLSEWCEKQSISYKTVRDRLKRGWSYQDAIFKPVDVRFRRKVIQCDSVL